MEGRILEVRYPLILSDVGEGNKELEIDLSKLTNLFPDWNERINSLEKRMNELSDMMGKLSAIVESRGSMGDKEFLNAIDHLLFDIQ